MKYFSVLFFAIALAWTWNIVHSSSDINFETHSGIQEKLALMIKNTVQNKKPTASDIVIEKIWTEVLGEGQVKASFIYSFKDTTEEGLITSRIQGTGILERKGDLEDGSEQWVLTQVQASSDAIVFDDATVITGNSNEDSQTAETVSQPEN